MEKAHLESIIERNLLLDKFTMALRSRVNTDWKSLPESGEEILTRMQTAIDERKWLDVALLSAHMWRDDWKKAFSGGIS
jgi:hypothetical protein